MDTVSGPERFTILASVPDYVADDDQLLAQIEQHMIPGQWADCVAQAGGVPVGDPTIRREPNLNYGCVLQAGDDDDPPIVDQVKLFMVVSGWAERNQPKEMP